MRHIASLLALSLATPAVAADATHPIVVELFQSQGCSSCPPANANVMRLAEQRPDILALSWQVTYWDYLGWKDSFADPAFTKRQYAYAEALHHDNVFTPQVVVNGRIDGVGTRAAELEDLVAAGAQPATGPAISQNGTQLAIAAGTGEADILLVTYNPNLVQVPVLRGENAGETLPHRNVVRGLRRLGTWNGQPVTLAVPATPTGFAQAILLQSRGNGPILAALRLKS